ncbi:MAG: thiol reductant ABC exporter subunit CydD [Desulfuromonadales bacterium]|nr:thiol reductant ABC exporter subunit CydD [Desulfuromonadales bacterium]
MTSTKRHDRSQPEAWLLGEAREVRRELLATVGWAGAAGLLIVLQARLLAVACQRIVIERSGISSIVHLAAGVATVALVRGGLVLLSERRAVAAAAVIKQRVRSVLYRRLLSSRPAGLAGEETGALVEAVTAGIEGLEPYVSRYLPHLALAALLPLLALAFAIPAEWHSGLVLLFSAPFIPLFMILIGRGSEKLNQRQWQRLSRMAGHLLDLVQGLPDLKICGAAKREAEVVAHISDQYRQGTMAVLRVAFLSAFALEFFATVGTAVVAVVIGFRLLNASLTLVDGLFVLLLAPEFYLPLRTLGLSYHSRMQGVAAAERIAPLMHAPEDAVPSGNLPAPVTVPLIVFENVSLRCTTERGGLSGINLELPATGMTALVGESGSGKTTLARLIAGLTRPESGRIMVNGIDLQQLDPESWRAGLSWVSQRPFFFKGTIRENLVLGCPDASEEDILTALDAAAATTFTSQLPAGIDTELGDRGAGLSGGELRRLALARAFLRNALLIVLDEPTAGLDRENERLVGEALERMARDRTVLLISHREETIRRAGRIALMTAGRLERVVTADEYWADVRVMP